MNFKCWNKTSLILPTGMQDLGEIKHLSLHGCTVQPVSLQAFHLPASLHSLSLRELGASQGAARSLTAKSDLPQLEMVRIWSSDFGLPTDICHQLRLQHSDIAIDVLDRLATCGLSEGGKLAESATVASAHDGGRKLIRQLEIGPTSSNIESVLDVLAKPRFQRTSRLALKEFFDLGDVETQTICGMCGKKQLLELGLTRNAQTHFKTLSQSTYLARRYLE